MMTTTVYAILPPPDDGGRWQRLVAARAAAITAELDDPVIDDAEEYFEEVGWPRPDGTRQLGIDTVKVQEDPRDAAENHIVQVADLPAGTVSLLFSSSW